MADITPIPSSRIFDEWAIKACYLIRWKLSSEDIIYQLQSNECPNIPRAIKQGAILARIEEITESVVSIKKP